MYDISSLKVKRVSHGVSFWKRTPNRYNIKTGFKQKEAYPDKLPYENQANRCFTEDCICMLYTTVKTFWCWIRELLFNLKIFDKGVIKCIRLLNLRFVHPLGIRHKCVGFRKLIALSKKHNLWLPLSWPAGHICPAYKQSFLVRWDNSIPLFLHAAIYLEVSLFRWTSQNAFSRETAVYKWYSVQCCIAALHTVLREHRPNWEVGHLEGSRLAQQTFEENRCVLWEQAKILETANNPVYKWYCVQCCYAALHTVSFVHGCFAGKCILTGSTE